MWVGSTRTFGVVLAVVVVVALAGGTTVSTGSVDRVCGPGETAIVEINQSVSTVSISGEVTDRGESLFVVDDGTGTALVYTSGNAIGGDCVAVTGLAHQTTGTDRNVDVIVLAMEGQITPQR